MFLVDMRGLSDSQTHFVSDCLHESSNFFSVRDEQNDFIKIELSDAQKMALILTHGTDVRKRLADILNSFCEQRSDLFMPNANYAWWTRILHSANNE
jgi:hypothetical protein